MRVDRGACLAAPAVVLAAAVVLALALGATPAKAELPLCDANVCSDWIDSYGGNVTELKHGDFFALQFVDDEVTNLWQVTVCGDVFGYPATHGEFELFLLDDANLALALAGKDFANCSCGDINGDDLTNTPTSSTCVSVSEDDTGDVQTQNALECDFMNSGRASQATCSNVAVRCVSANPTDPNSTEHACRIGLSVQVLKADPFLAWWSFEYIPIVFGFCLVVMFVGVVSRRLRQQHQRAAMLRLLEDRAASSLLDNEHGGGEYSTVVVEGTIVDDTTLPTGTYIVGTPAALSSKPMAAYYDGGAGDEKIFQADVEDLEGQQCERGKGASPRAEKAKVADEGAAAEPAWSAQNGGCGGGGDGGSGGGGEASAASLEI